MGWLAVDGWLAAWSGPSNPTLWAERRTATTAKTTKQHTPRSTDEREDYYTVFSEDGDL